MEEILIIGGENSGKTLFIKRLIGLTSSILSDLKTNYVNETTLPTIGVEITNIELNNKSYNIREIGSTLLLQWNAFIPDCHYLIYVIDCSDYSNVITSQIQIYEILTSNQLNKKPFLLALNKMDLVDDVSLSIIHNFLDFPKLKTEYNIDVISGSSIDTTLCNALFDWIKAL